MIRGLFFIFALLVLVSPAKARDERSITDLSKALAGLASNVDPAEAELLSVTAHTKARSLARSGHGPAAANAIHFGEPVLSTAITKITERGPVYGEHLATEARRVRQRHRTHGR